ncbi:hypothetical protein B6N25_07645 [Sphingobacteriales bacterium TSM_CSS]|nr:hypothetical protein B6N25_07645 [Sphingobacteriales bacterium TSM_CSS]
MDKKLINRLAVTIEKINYLYRNIRKREENMQKLELALLKKYVTELYDGLVEVELSLKQDAPLIADEHPLQKREQVVKEKVMNETPPEPEIIDLPEPEPVAEPEPIIIPEPEPEPEPEPVVVPLPEPVVVPPPEPEPQPVMVLHEQFVEDVVPTGQIDQSFAQDLGNMMTRKVQEEVEEEVIMDDEGSVKTQILTDFQKANLLKQEEEEESEQETVAMELNDVLGNKQNDKTIADKFATKSGATEFAIGHNQRIDYINHLFGGDEESYNIAIDDLANAKGYIEALTYVNLNLRYDYKWDDHDPKVREFLDMIKHKFLGGNN